MALDIEEILNEENVAKSLFFPKDFDNLRTLIWSNVFEFSTNKETGEPYGESVIWEKYALDSEDKHAIGKGIAYKRKTKNPNYSYEGYMISLTQAIREISNGRGHGFDVEHKPAEGIYHAEILFKPNPNNEFKKNDKTELKGYLCKVFSELVANI